MSPARTTTFGLQGNRLVHRATKRARHVGLALIVRRRVSAADTGDSRGAGPKYEPAAHSQFTVRNHCVTVMCTSVGGELSARGGARTELTTMTACESVSHPRRRSTTIVPVTVPVTLTRIASAGSCAASCRSVPRIEMYAEFPSCESESSRNVDVSAAPATTAAPNRDGHGAVPCMADRNCLTGQSRWHLRENRAELGAHARAVHERGRPVWCDANAHLIAQQAAHDIAGLGRAAARRSDGDRIRDREQLGARRIRVLDDCPAEY